VVASARPPEAANPIEAGFGVAATPDAAARWCERYARRQYENFTVVSRFLPDALRPAMFTVYAFCRFTDDLGDEAAGGAADRAAARLALLDEWEAETGRAFAETGPAPRHPIAVALRRVAQDAPLNPDGFRRLIEANRIDQRQSRYQTFADVLHYCDHSANPVGEMVLALFGYTDAERLRLSDATCTALQLANHWQDVARDYRAGRIYLPLDDLARFGVEEAQIPAQRCDANFRALMRFEVDRAESFFREGLPLIDMVERPLRVDLQLFTDGGRAVLRAIERQDYDVLRHRPTVSKPHKVWLLARALVRQRLGIG
jgi:squalene synthase HpnC